MPTNQAKKIGTAALALAVLATAFVTVAQPAVAASGDCSEEDTLTFGTQDSGTLDRSTGDTLDIWKVEVPTLTNPDSAFLDVDEAAVSDDLQVSLYEKDSNGNCVVAESVQDVKVKDRREAENLPGSQIYWIHVEFVDSGDNVGDYSILMDEA